MPVTVKVNIDQAGFATSSGVTLQKDWIAASNSPVVDRLLAAGAVIVGRTNTPAFSYRWFTSNRLHGRTLNPRNPALTPGGSSGGAASAVGAGIGHIAHGTDIAGFDPLPRVCLRRARPAAQPGPRGGVQRIESRARGIGHALRLSEPGAEMALARTRHELELCGNEVASQDAARSHQAP